MKLTAWENHPDKVHEEVVTPKVQKLRSAVSNLLVVVVEHAGSIVEYKTINLSNRDNDLERVAEGMLSGDECGNNKAQWTPGKLFGACLLVCGIIRVGG